MPIKEAHEGLHQKSDIKSTVNSNKKIPIFSSSLLTCVMKRKVTIKADKISKYFTEDYSSEDIENIIYQLLEEWQNKQ